MSTDLGRDGRACGWSVAAYLPNADEAGSDQLPCVAGLGAAHVGAAAGVAEAAQQSLGRRSEVGSGEGERGVRPKRQQPRRHGLDCRRPADVVVREGPGGTWSGLGSGSGSGSESGLGLGLGLANRYDLARVDAWGDNQVTKLSG